MHLERGEFDKSLSLSDQVKSEASYLEELAKSLQAAGEVGIFKDGIELIAENFQFLI